ncbi:MAG: alpha/beta hydrolase [Actinobacteria bacterium]|nr:alpha/beta hydrolase [Actinomycetota bacterium]MBW3651149.1 alpha/beta hydrolase [Actinomycetota bacterium]
MRKAFDQGRIFGTTFGQPPLRVLALPGWLHTASDFVACLTELTPTTGSVALDLPGFGGATPEPSRAMGSAGYAAAVAPVLHHDLEAPAVVIGHSFGGRVALHLAVLHPERVRALVLTGVPLLRRTDRPPVKAPIGFRLAKALHGRGLLDDERMEAMRRRSGSSDYRNAPSTTMRDVLVTVTNETYEEQLAAVACPVELVWGEADDQAPVTVAERAATLLGPKANLTTLAGVGHFTPTSAPEAIVAAVRRHL